MGLVYEDLPHLLDCEARSCIQEEKFTTRESHLQVGFRIDSTDIHLLDDADDRRELVPQSTIGQIRVPIPLNALLHCGDDDDNWVWGYLSIDDCRHDICDSFLDGASSPSWTEIDRSHQGHESHIDV